MMAYVLTTGFLKHNSVHVTLDYEELMYHTFRGMRLFSEHSWSGYFKGQYNIVNTQIVKPGSLSSHSQLQSLVVVCLGNSIYLSSGCKIGHELYNMVLMAYPHDTTSTNKVRCPTAIFCLLVPLQKADAVNSIRY